MTDPTKEGVLLVDKEKGKTAFYLVKVLRKLSGIQKIGHAGILDPFATGVMVMLIGRSYTKIADRFLLDDKEYIATLKLGEETTTFDCDGSLKRSSSYIPTLEEIQKALEAFQGKILQTPPMFSAKKVNGQKLYLLARKGIEIERKPVEIELTSKLIDYSYPHVTLHISCSKGTYIRTIGHELGEKLGSYAHLVDLKRVRSGSFHLKDCIEATALKEPSFSYLPYLRRAL